MPGGVPLLLHCDGPPRAAIGPWLLASCSPSRLSSVRNDTRLSAAGAPSCYLNCLKPTIMEPGVRVEMVKISSEKPEPSLIRYAADQIRSGEVLGMPTDTFYGLAADPFNLRAVERVYEIKSRSRHKPLSLLMEHVDQAEEFARPLPDDFKLLARRFWPGPLTMIVPAASQLPLKVTANTGNVALPVPSAEIPLAVVRAAKIPITATSANLSGAVESSTAAQVRDQLQDRISLIVDGRASPRTSC